MSFSISKKTGLYSEPEEEENIFDEEKQEEELVFIQGAWKYVKVERSEYGQSWNKEKWQSSQLNSSSNNDTQT